MDSPFTDLVDEEYVRQCTLAQVSSTFTPSDKFKRNFLDSPNSLKKFARKWCLPVFHPVRHELWPRLINRCYGTNIKLSSSDSPTAHSNHSTQNSFDLSTLTGLELADRRLQTSYHLNARGLSTLRSLLHELSVARPEIVYAPQTWALLALLLHFHPPEVSAACLNALLAVPGMLVQSKVGWRSVCLAMEYLGAAGFAGKRSFRRLQRQQAIYNSTSRTLNGTQVSNEKAETSSPSADVVEPRYQLGIWPIAVWQLPFECIVPLVDCFIVEGPKVLFRAGLILWHLAAKVERRKQMKSAEQGCNCDIASTLQYVSSTFPVNGVIPFLRAVFRIRRLSKMKVEAAIKKAAARQSSNAGLELVDSLVVPCALPGQRTYTAFTHVRAELAVKGRSSLRSPAHSSSNAPLATLTSSKLANPKELAFLISEMKDELLAASFTPCRIFSTETDGVSLVTFFRAAKDHAISSGRPETILLVRTLSGEGLVGAFCTSQWDPCEKEKNFYGNGRSFLFRLRPCPPIIYHWDETAGEDRFQRSTATFIEVGGGLDSGPAGLRIDANLGQGESGSSPTYASDCLITKPEDKIYAASVNEKPFCSFKIGAVELLGFKQAVID